MFKVGTVGATAEKEKIQQRTDIWGLDTTAHHIKSHLILCLYCENVKLVLIPSEVIVYTAVVLFVDSGSTAGAQSPASLLAVKIITTLSLIYTLLCAP